MPIISAERRIDHMVSAVAINEPIVDTRLTRRSVAAPEDSWLGSRFSSGCASGWHSICAPMSPIRDRQCVAAERH